MIDFETLPTTPFFDSEAKHAISWLLTTRDDQEGGWAWVQFISPNEQNTAEVVVALLEYEHMWSDGVPGIVADSTRRWLLSPERHAQLSIDWSWVLLALTHVRENDRMMELVDPAEVESSMQTCAEQLLAMQMENGGWPDNPGEKPTTTRTSLALWALSVASKHLGHPNLKEATDKAVSWLKDAQNQDGGWGNLDVGDLDSDYQRETGFSLEELAYQCESNAACTGYALVALDSCGAGSPRSLRSAAGYLRSAQDDNGSWAVFTEVGIRNGARYTFRHFSTAWALRGLVCQGLSDHTDEMTINGLNYLAQLQDDNYGGWRSSPDADNYTWATCNALATIKLVKNQLSEIKARHFLRIVCEWWDLKRDDASFSFSFAGCTLAFNRPMGLLFCLVFSMMTFAAFTLFGQWADTAFVSVSEDIASLVKGLGAVGLSAVLGLPWIVFVKNVFFDDKSGWINSIGWVYGIITGFVLALYQFIV